MIEAIDELESLTAEMTDDERATYSALLALAEAGELVSEDWPYGAPLVRDSYFTAYAQELADDLGLMIPEATYGRTQMRPDLSTQWPFTCIDWEQAARELQQDYCPVEFDGVTYWVR